MQGRLLRCRLPLIITTLCEQVEALLDRHGGEPPVMQVGAGGAGAAPVAGACRQ
jgi:hypothetical protein